MLPDRLGSLDGGADAGLDVVVVTLVLVLLLTPDQISIYVTISFCFHQVEWERGELRGEKSDVKDFFYFGTTTT